MINIQEFNEKLKSLPVSNNVEFGKQTNSTFNDADENHDIATQSGIRINRNSTLFKIGCYLQNNNISDDRTEEFLTSANKKDCYEPLDKVELNKIIQNVKNYKKAWPKPLIIEDVLPDVEDLNLDILPKVLHEYIISCSNNMQVPPDYLAISIIISLSGLIGNRISIRPKKFDPWTVIPNLWGMIVGSPSSMKSPSLAVGCNFSKRLETEKNLKIRKLAEEICVKIQEKNIYIEQIEKKSKKNENKILDLEDVNFKNRKKHTNSEELEFYKDKQLEIDSDKSLLIEELNELKSSLPKKLRLIVSDVTPEKLQEMLSESPHGLTAVHDELTSLLKSFSKKGREDSRSLYLSSWNGNSQIICDRISRGTTIAHKACLSVIGCIQPGPIEHYVDDVLSSNDSDDGFFPRFHGYNTNIATL